MTNLAARTTYQLKKRGRSRNVWVTLAFLTPATALIGIFIGTPVVLTFLLSFTDAGLTGPLAVHPQFVGFANFVTMVTSSQFWQSIRASLEYLVGGGLLGQVGLGLAAALFLRTVPKWVRQSLVVLVVLAWVIPEIVGAFVWSAFLQSPGGLLDAFVRLFGISSQPWLYKDPMLFVILAHAWKGAAFSMLVLGAAIESIPKELTEAARVDGARGLTMLSRVTLPLIRNALATTLVLVTLWTLADFTMIFILTGGGPLFQTDVLTVFTYQNSFSFYELGYGTALSLVLLVLSGILSLLYLRLVGRQDG